jgi:translation elongation factor EF-4
MPGTGSEVRGADEIGHLSPQARALRRSWRAGEVGYVISNIKSLGDVVSRRHAS